MQRNQVLDAMRMVAAFAVVCIHYWIVPDSMIGRYVTVVARFAVPFFFMLTGFYLLSIINKGRFKVYMKKIVMLTIGANILFLILQSSCHVVNVTSVKDIFLQLIGAPIWGAILWFLFALIYACLCIYFIYRKWPRVIKFLPLLLIGNFCFTPLLVSLILQGYGWHYSIIVNNFIFVGIPWVTLGWNMHSLLKWKIDWKIWVLLVIGFTVCAVFEARMINKAMHSWIQPCLSTIPQTVCIMMAALTFPQDKWRLGWLSTAGRKYSTYIYIFHTIWIANKTMPTTINNTPICMTMFVFFTSLILAILYVDVVKPLCGSIVHKGVNVLRKS